MPGPTVVPLHALPRRGACLDPCCDVQPLIPLVAAPVADPLSAVALARLVLWRQVYARWPVHLLVALVVATSWLTPERWQPGAGLFALVGVVAYALVLGLGPAAREELFWQGLGGAPGVRQGTALLLEFGLVGAALLAVRGVELKQMLWTLGISVCILALAGFSRSWAVSWAGRLLVCVGTLLVGLLTLMPSWWISKWPLLFGAELRLGVLVGGAVLLRLLLAARRPASAAGRKLRGWGWILLPLSTAAFLVVEGAWPVPVNCTPTSFGRLLVPVMDNPLAAGQRIWRVDAEGATALPLRGPLSSPMLHDSGAVSYQRGNPGKGGLRVGLLDPSGATMECPVSSTPDLEWLSADGRGAVWLLDDHSLVRLDVDSGCRSTTEVPDGLPLVFDLMNRQRLALGSRLLRPGPFPGTVWLPRFVGEDLLLDLLTRERR